MRSRLVSYGLIFVAVLIITSYLARVVAIDTSAEGFVSRETYPKALAEGFQNPFEAFFKQLKEQQSNANAYNQWVGYVYKTAEQNSSVLNDFKEKVFAPSCDFREDWATNQQGMVIPTPANSVDLANLAYKTYLNCLKSGNPICVSQLGNARARFMESGCQYNIRNVKDIDTQVRTPFR